jgi:hypothetical protein
MTVMLDLHRLAMLYLRTSATVLAMELFIFFVLGLGAAVLMQRWIPHRKIQSSKPVFTWVCYLVTMA